MRERLRHDGYHLLVRRSADREVWRLLVLRALYRGLERRYDSRLAVGSDVLIGTESGDRAAPAVLVDLSNRGCRLSSDHPFQEGTRLAVRLPSGTAGEEPLRLDGTVVRVASDAAVDAGRKMFVLPKFGLCRNHLYFGKLLKVM